MNQPTSHDAATTGSEGLHRDLGHATHATQGTSKTVSMPVLAISIDDGGETLKLTLVEPEPVEPEPVEPEPVEPEPVEPIPCHPVSTRILAVHLGVCAADKGAVQTTLDRATKEVSMESVISDLLSRFEHGRVSRRELVKGLAMLAAAGGGAATASARQETPFSASRIDHISIQVTDIPRSIAFYQEVFGLSIPNEDRANEIVRMGTSSILVSLHHKPPTGIVDHYAIAVDGFDRESATRALEQRGLTPDQNLDYGFHVRDPEGIPVQIVAT